ncbi:MAG: cysteine hydrolase family protein [Candidatus Eremiobacterota bacterium]
MNRVLLVIDVQNEYFSGKLPIKYPEKSMENIVRAMEHAEKNHIPVILIQHTALQENSPVFKKGSPEWEIHSDIKKRKYDSIIEKNFPGSFTGTGLNDMLKEKHADTVTICGYMTQMCCDTTARQAMHLGYKVEFLSDATGAPDVSNYAGHISAEELHKAVLIIQASRFSEVLSVEDWMKKNR